jgi:hypothetical protein
LEGGGIGRGREIKFKVNSLKSVSKVEGRRPI